MNIYENLRYRRPYNINYRLEEYILYKILLTCFLLINSEEYSRIVIMFTVLLIVFHYGKKLSRLEKVRKTKKKGERKEKIDM